MIPEELALRLAMTRADLEAQAVAEDREHDETGRVLADVDPPAECAPRVQHRNHGWGRWRGWCPGHRVGTRWGNQDPAQDWVLDHLQDNPETVCVCYDTASLEYSAAFPCTYCKDRNMA